MFKIISVFKFIQFPDQLVDSAIQGDIQHVITSNLDEVNNATIDPTNGAFCEFSCKDTIKILN
jgi:hypothetical protein